MTLPAQSVRHVKNCPWCGRFSLLRLDKSSVRWCVPAVLQASMALMVAGGGEVSLVQKDPKEK